MYHVTEMGGEVVWRHAILDFTKSKTPGRLTSETGLLDENEEAQPYTVEAGRRDERFIVFLRSPISEESAATYIFPYMGLTSFSLHHGVSFLETWDGTRAITPAILSRKVLHDHEGKLLSQKVVHDHEGNQPGHDHEGKLGTLPPETARSLDRLWRREIYRLCSFFPEAGATTRSGSLG
jgi:hypothetical protein